MMLFSLPNYCEQSVISVRVHKRQRVDICIFKKALLAEMILCLISRWVWEQQGWVSLMQRSYRTSTSLQASSPGPVQDVVLVLLA